MQIWKPCDKKWRHNDIISKNNRKVRTSAKPNKLYIVRKVLMRAIQKSTFYWIWATMSKVMGIYVKFWHFLWWPLPKYGLTWPKKQISKKLYFFLILHNISGRKALYFRSYQPKTSRGGVPPPPSAFRVKKTIMNFKVIQIHWFVSVKMQNAQWALFFRLTIDLTYHVSVSFSLF